MIDVKAGDKACKKFVLFSILYLIITAVVLDTPAEIFAGMKSPFVNLFQIIGIR